MYVYMIYIYIYTYMHEWYWVKKKKLWWSLIQAQKWPPWVSSWPQAEEETSIRKWDSFLDMIPSIPFSVHPGSSFTFLTETAIEIINHSPYPNRNIHVYFVAGLIDLSEKITDINYREYICNDSFTDSFTHMRNLLDDTQEKITNTSATPCFATITPMHINTSNHHLLHT